MTALSPLEERETTRFGMFDEETFREIVEHADDVPGCEAAVEDVPCTEPASHAGVCTACGRKALLVCTQHAEMLAAWHHPIRHVPCGATKIDLIRVVPL